MSKNKYNEIIEEIEKNYGSLMRNIAGEILNDVHEAEDVIQSVYMEIFDRHSEVLVLTDKRLRNYLCTAVKNTALNLAKKKSRNQPTDQECLTMLMDEDQVDMNAFADEYGFGVEMRELISSLDLTDKEILRLRLGLGYDYRTVATAVGKSEATVRKRMERALKRLSVIILDEEVKKNDR